MPKQNPKKRNSILRSFFEWRKHEKPSSQRRASFVLQNRELLLPAGVLVLVLLLITAVVFSTVDRLAQEGIPLPIDIDGNNESRHPLTGAVIEEDLEVLPQVFGVMVENSADAWPLVGLDKAFLVIEAPVESNIPRFIVFSHADSAIEKIGPVRSTRPYYIDWNDELDAVYAHVGGSPDALALIRDVYDTIDLNEFFQGEYFYRQNGTRYAPHNTYTNTKLLTTALNELTLDAPEYGTWMFGDGVSKGNTSVTIDWMDGVTYDVDWKYDATTNRYTRFQGLSVMKMEDGATIQADNVVVMATEMRVLDQEGRKSLETVGEGDAYMIQNGEAFFGRWKKETRTDRLRFYTHDGHEITMNAGVTWIEVIEDLAQLEVYE